LLLEKAAFDHPENPELKMKLAVATHRDPETRSRATRMFRAAEAAFPGDNITDPTFLTAAAEAMIEAGQSRAGEERLRAAIRAYPPEAKKETAAALRRSPRFGKRRTETRRPPAPCSGAPTPSIRSDAPLTSKGLHTGPSALLPPPWLSKPH
jgi:hypothetical protein